MVPHVSEFCRGKVRRASSASFGKCCIAENNQQLGRGGRPLTSILVGLERNRAELVRATFDALFNEAVARPLDEQAAAWALTCRNPDGGFGHYPGSTSDADAVYFHVGVLVMAGFLRPVDPLPRNPHLYSWGHLFPQAEQGAGK